MKSFTAKLLLNTKECFKRGFDMSKGYTDVRYGESETNPLRRLRAFMLLSSFKGRTEDIYRAVHHFKDNPFFFANYSKEFFCKTDALLNRSLIKAIRRLFVTVNESELNSEDSQRIIAFHSFNRGYDYRVIFERDYAEMLVSHGFHPSIDFGIFGVSRVYRARTDRPDLVIGTWTRKRNEISKYLEFFEDCWNSTHSFKITPHISSISLYELFNEPNPNS